MKAGAPKDVPAPHLGPLSSSKGYYCYFGPGHFGWLFGLSQGFALPLKCPELPACGLSPKAAAAPPNDIVSANMSAVINNVTRFLILSHPSPPKRVLQNLLVSRCYARPHEQRTGVRRALGDHRTPVARRAAQT